mgnify:CR=1 FL=1
MLQSGASGGTYKSQIWVKGNANTNNQLFFRHRKGPSGWNSWDEIYHTGNLTSLSQLTDNIGVATHIANTSNPHSVTKAQVGLGNVDNTSDLNKPISTATQTALNLKVNKAGDTLTGNLTAPTFIGSLSGNASTATKLQTPRTIWGQSFDGSGNVSGALSGATTGVFSSTVQATTAILTNLTANYLPKHTASGLVNSLIYDDGTNVGIGEPSPSAKLHVAGNILSTGEITAYVASDRRLKHNITPLVSSLDIIDKLNPVSYYWNQKAKELNPMKSDSLDYGLIAQEVENVLPGVVHGIFDDKYKSIDYIKLIPIMIAAIKELKQKINKL